MHCDTIQYCLVDRSGDFLYSNKKASIDFKRLKEADSLAQFFAIFLHPKSDFDKYGIDYMEDDDYIDFCIKTLKNQIDKHNDMIGMAYSYQDIVENHKNNKISALLTIEDGRSIDSLEKLQIYHEKGIRLVSLTWNFENSIGYPNSNDENIMGKGLKDFGIQVIENMNEIGMMIDVSHLSDGGFYDVAKHSKKPFLASHSNSRKLSNVSRNLTDDMIKIIADKGGLIGINFCPPFLNDSNLAKGLEENVSKISDMIRHIKHIVDVGGEDVIGIGSDFDGIGGSLEIDNPKAMGNLFESLNKEGFSDDFIEKFAYKNSLNFIKESI